MNLTSSLAALAGIPAVPVLSLGDGLVTGVEGEASEDFSALFASAADEQAAEPEAVDAVEPGESGNPLPVAGGNMLPLPAVALPVVIAPSPQPQPVTVTAGEDAPRAARVVPVRLQPVQPATMPPSGEAAPALAPAPAPALAPIIAQAAAPAPIAVQASVAMPAASQVITVVQPVAQDAIELSLPALPVAQPTVPVQPTVVQLAALPSAPLALPVAKEISAPRLPLVPEGEGGEAAPEPAAARSVVPASAPVAPSANPLPNVPPVAPIITPPQPVSPAPAPVVLTAAPQDMPRHDFAQVIDRLTEARELSRPGRAEMQLSHREFGQVSLAFDLNGQGLKVAMTSQHSGFAPAAQAALAEAARSDAPAQRQDGASQFTASQQQGAAPQADPQASRQQHDQQAPRRDRPVAEQLPRPSGEQAEANASRHQGGLFA